MSTIANKTIQFTELLTMDKETVRDLFAKYSLLADGYAGSAGTKLIQDNKDTYVKLLSPTMIDYMLFLSSSGSMAAELAMNSNLAKILDTNSNVCVTKIAKRLADEGWNIPNTTTLDEVKAALLNFGISTTDDANNADILIRNLDSVIPDIDFDDIEMNDFISDEDEAGTYDANESNGLSGIEDDELNAAELDLFAGSVVENFEVSLSNRTGEQEDEEDLIDIPTEKEAVYNPKVLKAEIEEAKVSVLGDKLSEEVTGDEVPSWARDTEGDEVGLSDLPDEVDSVITSIIQRIEGVMRSCFELDRPYGIISENGLIKYHTDKQRNTLVIDSPKPQGGRSEMEMLYKLILQAAGVKLRAATDVRYVPNYDNITGKSSNAGQETNKFDYYPGQMLKYALGFVRGNKHSTWKSFEKELRDILKKRLNEFYKKENKDGISEYYLYRENFVKIYSNSLLVIAYSSSGITIRASLIGMNNGIEMNIKETLKWIPIFANAKVTVFPVSGYNDVVDIQIIYDMDTVLGKPSWAYKALKVKLDNGEAPSLLTGLPIGKKVNGEIVEFKLDPSSRFMLFVAAGSGSGKGVLTLSLAAAALGSGIPLFYTDYKPDMAPIFWEISKKLNKNVYSFDCNVKVHKNDPTTGFELGSSMPSKLKPVLEQYAGAFMYLRSLALMCAIADYRNTHGFTDNGILFVFDEIQAMQRLICNAVNKVQELYNENKPSGDAKKDDGDEEVYEYCAKLLNWMNSVDTGLDKYTITTGRQGAVFSMFIGQNATAELWNGIIPKIKLGKGPAQDRPFLARLLKCGTVTKLMGKGTTGSQYGLSGANITNEENLYITKYRYFAMYDGPNASKADVQAFKPFLTLNYDDIFSKCWINGVGKTYGYKNVGTKGDRASMVQGNAEYTKNMQEAFPGETGYCNEYNVHPGVGLLGLSSMYCNGDIGKLSNSFSKSYDFVVNYFEATGLNARYSTPEQYMYDMSYDAWLLQDEMQDYSKVKSSDSDWDTEENSSLDTGMSMGSSGSDDAGYDESEDFEDLGGQGSYGGQASEFTASSTLGSQATKGQSLEEKYGVQRVPESALPREVIEMQRRKAALEESGRTLGGNSGAGGFSGYEQTMSSIDIEQDIEGTEDSNYTRFNGEQGFVNSSYSEPETDGINVAANQPYYMPPAENVIFQAGGKTGRVVYVTPDKTTKTLGLTKENSVVISMTPHDTSERFAGRLFKTLGGTQYEFKSRWKVILDGVTTKKNVDLITRATLLEDAIVFNKKMVATINILGGEEDIRIEDIVNFKMTADKFPNIRELIVDSTIFERAQAELSEPIEGLFRVFKNLNKLCVIEAGCGVPKIFVSRSDIENGILEEKARAASEKAIFKNQMEAVAAAKNPNLRLKRPGYQSKVWEASKKFQGDGWAAAKDALLAKNPKLFTAAGLGVATIAVLGVGAIAGMFGKIGNLIMRR